MNQDNETKAIPIRIKDDNDSNCDYIGSYGSPNTYTADLPESIRNRYTTPDPTQRRAYMNPNHSYV